jgi:hypothetical protein
VKKEQKHYHFDWTLVPPCQKLRAAGAAEATA